MPEMDGPKVAKAIKDILSSSLLMSEDNYPIICCCSAYGELSKQESALAPEMDHSLVKPLALSDFVGLSEKKQI